jgi:hypothetical protein
MSNLIENDSFHIPRLNTVQPRNNGISLSIASRLGTFMFMFLFFLLLLLFFFYPRKDVKPIPDIDVEGIHVMIVEDTTDHDKLTVGQQGIFTSPEITQWADKHCARYGDLVAFLKVDKEDRLDAVNKSTGEREFPEVFEELQSKILDESESLPAVGILTPDGWDVTYLPEDKDRMLSILRSVE